MGRRLARLGHPTPEFSQKLFGFRSWADRIQGFPMKTKYVPSRLPEKLWLRVMALAKAGGRSGQAQLDLLVERALGGEAESELRRLAAERASRMMEDRG